MHNRRNKMLKPIPTRSINGEIGVASTMEINGEGGIRTHGTLRLTRFQVERIRPLCHLSR